MTSQLVTVVATPKGPSAVYLDSWINPATGRAMYTPRCPAFGLGGRDFASRAAAVRHISRVTGRAL